MLMVRYSIGLPCQRLGYIRSLEARTIDDLLRFASLHPATTMKLLFNHIFFITALLLSPVLCAIAGKNAYSIRSESSSSGLQRSVYTDGYASGKKPVVRADIDTSNRVIVVKDAYNARDKTPSHLYLNQILEWLWTNEGGRLSDLRSIEFDKVVNAPTRAAIQEIRKRRGLANDARFRVTEPWVSRPEKGASDLDWTSLSESPFGKVARRVAAAGGQNVDAFEIMSETWIMGGKARYYEYLTVKFD
ncbi:hypothetical protein LZ30DRAFT_739067 [Colletotrichum cereale]|nr:hypothetical protein LZ30DRAFT_739067 [Colletotrichum cereale]